MVTVRKVLKRFFKELQISYSQFGEDLILEFLFHEYGLQKPLYLDIGANEPKFISNTYLFYEKGSHGILVEPNPYLCKKLKKHRSRDTVIQAGVDSTNSGHLDFYVFKGFASGLSTFSKKDVDFWQKVGIKNVGKFTHSKIIQVPILTVREILDKYFANKTPDLISIDVEGFDIKIIQSFPFEKYRPSVFCIETISHDREGDYVKIDEIGSILLKNNYFLYADTRINSIYVNKELERRKYL